MSGERAMAHAAPWFAVARGEMGVKERAGDADNPRVIEYLQATTLPEPMLHDETPWCSAFANWCMREAGMLGTGKANARSWLQWGQPLDAPRLGCVVVFSRDEAGPASGHVAFYVNDDVAGIHVLGGNQHSQVCVATYPRARLLGYRWPTMADRPA